MGKDDVHANQVMASLDSDSQCCGTRKDQAMTTPELRDLLARATKGPWFVHDFTGPEVNDDPQPQDVTVSCDHPATITVASMGRALTATLDEARANAALIALAPTHAAAIEALTAERDALREALRQIDVIVRMPGRWDHDAIEIKRITDRALSKENRDE
jgi:hypothetical protein